MIVRAGAATPALRARVTSTMAVAAEALGMGHDPLAVRARVDAIAGEPLELYERHACWPSPFTAGGAPVELSLKLSGADGAAIRCVADVTDYRAGSEVNLARYRTAALLVTEPTGACAADIEQLSRVHLDGVPALWQARAMHGLGFGRAGWSRGCVYFRTGWLEREQFGRRLPHVARALDDVAQRHRSPTSGRVEVMGYDFVAATNTRWKAYTWPQFASSATFADLVGDHPDLAPAQIVFERLRSRVVPDALHPLMLQVVGEEGALHQRLFFFTASWGANDPAGMRRLLDTLWALGIDSSALVVLARAAADNDLGLAAPLVAVGLERGAPSATVYLWPRSGADVADARAMEISATLGYRAPAVVPANSTRSVVERGVEFLLGTREADGRWSRDGSSGFVTAFVAAMLLNTAAEQPDLAATAEWLVAGYRAGAGWERADGTGTDIETTALALSVLTRSGYPPPDDATAVLLGLRERLDPAQPRVAATVLMALVELAPGLVTPVLDALFAIVGVQGQDGGWGLVAETSEALTIWQVAHALRAFEASRLAATAIGGASRIAAARAIARSVGRLRTLPVAREPWELATWLGAWATAAADVRDRSVGRAAAALAELQRHDGAWPGCPATGLPPAEATLLTTAAAVGALQCMRRAGREGS
jgi:hypothetical protein